MLLFIQVELQDKIEELAKQRNQSAQEENRASSLQKSIRERESDLDDLKMDVKRVSYKAG